MWQRHSLLPELEGSQAVLVACGDGGPDLRGPWGPEEMARNLAEVLTSPDDGRAAFRADSVQVLVDPKCIVEQDRVLGRVISLRGSR